MIAMVDYAFQIASLLISGAALIYAALAFRAAKHAIDVARESTTTDLRIRINESIAEAERSFLTLQAACQATREQWEERLGGGFASWRVKREKPAEIQRIIDVESAARRLLGELKNAAPNDDRADSVQLETFAGRAKMQSVKIERLRLELEAPRPVRF